MVYSTAKYFTNILPTVQLCTLLFTHCNILLQYVCRTNYLYIAHCTFTLLKTFSCRPVTVQSKMDRTWVSGGGGDGDVESFSVMQWNILAQTLALHGNFQFATEDVLDWQHRKGLIVKVERRTEFFKYFTSNDYIEGDSTTQSRYRMLGRS